MSDQTPPPGEPTNPPADDTVAHPVTPGTDSDVEGTRPTPPPPPPPGASTAGATATGDYPPPPPAKKSRTGLLIALVAALLVLALAAALVFVLVINKKDTHTIAVPTKAGGMARDTARESQLQSQLSAAEQQFKTQAKNVDYVKSGVFKQTDAARGPVGSLVFLGAKLKTDQSPTKFVDSFSKQASSNGFKIDNVAAGDGGGKAVCASQGTGQKVAICAWATNDTMGELIPTVPGYDSAHLAKILTALRADVEKSD